jgi:hypothetical protein
MEMSPSERSKNVSGKIDSAGGGKITRLIVATVAGYNWWGGELNAQPETQPGFLSAPSKWKWRVVNRLNSILVELSPRKKGGSLGFEKR